MIISPYSGTPVAEWLQVTQKLLDDFPVAVADLATIVLESWEDIFQTRIGKLEYKIGQHIIPQPQIMGFLLHEIIPLNLIARNPEKWQRGLAANEFDVKCLFDEKYSFEIKTSSDPSNIFGNRSYTFVSEVATKRRGGYMLAVNFEKFTALSNLKPGIRLIRFGWLDAEDWIGQRAQSGQQARLTKEAKAYKLKILWEKLEK